MRFYESKLGFPYTWCLKADRTADEKADQHRLSPGGHVLAGEAELGQE
jgi:hypothetical protein